MKVHRDGPKAIDHLVSIDEPGQDDTADIFRRICIVSGGCRFYFYHENGIFDAVEPHFFLLVPETDVEFLNVRLASPAGICPQTTDSPDAPDYPAIG